MSFPNNFINLDKIDTHELLTVDRTKFHKVNNYNNTKIKKSFPIPEDYYINNYSNTISNNNILPFNNFNNEKNINNYNNLPHPNSLNYTILDKNNSLNYNENKIENRNNLLNKVENTHFEYKPYIKRYDTIDMNKNNNFLSSNDHLNFGSNIHNYFNKDSVELDDLYKKKNNQYNINLYNSIKSDISDFENIK